ncbi:Transmembrane protein [Parasponia andersonii]|uniref:Transmembrane protein n=1 Tax=Parasponia andersonii TaxID=3476 RepID=A0A2P5DQM2_PARAD|nr:Transmembrane protein [Parasponia andersonii]
MATPSITFLSPPDSISILNQKPCLFLKPHKPSLSFLSPKPTFSSKNTKIFHNPLHKITKQDTPSWRIHATAGEAPPLEAVPTPLESSQAQIVSTGDDTSATVVSALLFVAFVGLTILTIGVIYIGVTDFLQKREREKFEKEESAKSKKNGKKKKVKARAGPRGFGQKLEQDEEDNDLI